jgi:hypothetical protein
MDKKEERSVSVEHVSERSKDSLLREFCVYFETKIEFQLLFDLVPRTGTGTHRRYG